MLENRREILAILKTTLEEITEVKTVVRSYKLIDITNYKTADLPLINIVEPEEEPRTELTTRRAIMLLGLSLRIFFVDWAEDPDTTYETLTKLIRDKVGANFTLGGKVLATWITSISKVDGEMPVYFYDIGLTCKYYLDQQST